MNKNNDIERYNQFAEKRRKEITEKYKTPMRDIKNIDYNKNVWLSLNKDYKGEVK